MDKIRIKTRIGELDIDPNTIITFEKGILGFEDSKRYALVDVNEKSPLKLLQSVDNPGLTFVVTNPSVFIPDYQLHVRRNDIEDLGVKDLASIVYLVIVTIPTDPSQMTANLKGPILINTENQFAKQLILDLDKYPVKYRLLRDQKKVANG